MREIANVWTGTTWFVEGDLADCFGSLDHQVMLEALAERIHDNRFLRLVRNMLTAGYLEDWVYHATHSGAPQGGVASPILSSIYLHKLDTFVEKVLIPEYTRGKTRAHNRPYFRLLNRRQRARQRGDRVAAREAQRQMRTMPSGDPQDPGYRRLRYCRYADDVLLGFVGPKAEAEEIKQRLATFLRDDLKLELSRDKTLITHARTQAARFLGYEITVQHGNNYVTKGQREANGKIRLRVPLEVIKAKYTPYLKRGKPARQDQWINNDDYTIVETYGSRYRGIVQYYLMATDVYRMSRLRWVMETSMLKTLAGKHHSTVSKMAAKHQATIETPHGKRRCFEATRQRRTNKPLVARFGGIPLKRQPMAVLKDYQPHRSPRYTELVGRLRKHRCELCERTDNVEVHHVRKLADLHTGQPPSAWAAIMLRKRRKTLVVCQPCHDHIHGRQPAAALT